MPQTIEEPQLVFATFFFAFDAATAADATHPQWSIVPAFVALPLPLTPSPSHSCCCLFAFCAGIQGRAVVIATAVLIVDTMPRPKQNNSAKYSRYRFVSFHSVPLSF